ncbi:MAG: xanthine dehydrogenase accessory protein XdhC [Pseudomonadota bacterium]
MSFASGPLAEFLKAHVAIVRVTITGVQGSAPRDVGTEMFVASEAFWGTIGGGRLEHLCLDAARKMLTTGSTQDQLDVALGPEIGQCCGGRVTLSLNQMTSDDKMEAAQRAEHDMQALPHVYVFGAGHLGRALANQFQHLPVKCILIDTRPDEIGLNTAAVDTRPTPLPEADIRAAPPGSAYVVATHDHALDFLLSDAALSRGDAAYVGMIGSSTKRAKFKAWVQTHGDGHGTDALICPIGSARPKDKRPSVIAAFVVAEVMRELAN